MVKAFFSGQQLPKSVTHTNLVLVPKKKEVITFADMRPISLSNFVDKIFSRVIHERLVELLPNIISEEQAGFVKGRSIVENVVIKLDMTKAYDRLSWLFLTKVLSKMGFPKAFIGLIFDLIGNNWYSILINGQPNGFFKSLRGFKQGDPLLPTLFILAAEALSRGLNSLHTNLYFCRFGIPKWSPKINHLSYTDDTIIFCLSDETSLRLVMEVLKAYESSSGQLVNKAKSAIYLHHLMDNENSNVGGSTRHWASWTNLCMHFEEGGIGFRSLHDVSKALFCKLWWNFRTKPTLWSAFISQKYCKKLNAVIVPWKHGSHVWRKILECRELIEHQIYWKLRMGSAQFWFDDWTEMGALYFQVPAEFGIDEDIHNVNDLVENGMLNVDKMFESLPEDLAHHIVQNIRPPTESSQLDTPFWMLETRGYFIVKSTWDYLRRIANSRLAYKMIWVKGLPFKISFFLWKVWKAKLSLDDFLPTSVWSYFLRRAGIALDGLSLHQAITKCWTTAVVPRLNQVLQALPAYIVWELWKRKKSLKYGEAVSVSRVIYQVSSTMQALVQLKKPALRISGCN
ncbi:uncharacterized protein [Nicotiana sylvestris]|uniref:uncharacterized protein n=1 Tax=Nicotiana sylvestris TaxID=4096 RepID=UPI00388C4ACF